MDLRDEIRKVYDKHGRLTPAILVAEVRPSEHPLHSRVFDRKPGEAAEAWYRHRAHELIQSVRCVYKQADEAGPERSVRAYQPVRLETGWQYEPSEIVADSEFLTEMRLRDMEREYRQLEACYGDMKEFVALARATVEKAA
jgi:hypothetical protein